MAGRSLLNDRSVLNTPDKQLAKVLSDDAIFIGDRVEYPPLVVGDRTYRFDAFQIRYIAALEQFQGDKVKACDWVGKSIEWANAFLESKKFNAFKRKKLALSGARNGALADFWWKEVLDGAKGYKEWYEATCELCHEQNVFDVPEAEFFRQDDMTFKATCKICLQPVVLTYRKEKYSPSREQVQCLQMIGDRKVPKIERVHHEFSTETFAFECESTAQGESPEA